MARNRTRSIFTHNETKCLFFELSQDSTQVIVPFGINNYNTVPNAPPNSSLSAEERVVGSVYVISSVSLQNTYNCRLYKPNVAYNIGDLVFAEYRYFISTINNNTNHPISENQMVTAGWQEVVEQWRYNTTYSRGAIVHNIPDPNDPDRNSFRYDYKYYQAVIDSDLGNSSDPIYNTVNTNRHISATYPLYKGANQPIQCPTYDVVSKKPVGIWNTSYWREINFVPSIPVDVGIIEARNNNGGVTPNYNADVYYLTTNTPIPARNILYFDRKIQIDYSQALVIKTGHFNSPRIDTGKTGKIYGTLMYSEFHE